MMQTFFEQPCNPLVPGEETASSLPSLSALAACRLLLFSFAFASFAQAADFIPLPLDPIANATLVDEHPGDGKGGWTDQGEENSLTGFPVGDIELAGIPFRIPAQGNAAVLFQNRYIPDRPPTVILPLQTDATSPQGRTLYLLSACAYHYDEGQEVARISVTYANGETQESSLLFRQHTGSWWTPSTASAAIVPWRGENALGIPTGVYLTALPLDQPDQPIREIKFAVRRSGGIFLLLGMTLSPEESRIEIPTAWQPVPTSTEGWVPQHPTQDTGTPSVWAASPLSTDRQLLAELSASAFARPTEEFPAIVRTAKLLGYTGLRLPSLEEMLAPKGKIRTLGIDPDAIAKFHALLAAAQAENLTISLQIGGGRSYGIDDRVAAFRDINPFRHDHLFLDPAARTLLLDIVQSTAAAGTSAPPSATILGEASLLTDNEDILTTPHFAMLQNAWCAWLTARYKDDETLFAAWQVPDTSSPAFPRETLRRAKVRLLHVNDRNFAQASFRHRFADQMLFLQELNHNWYATVAEKIRESFPQIQLSGATWLSTERSNERVIDFQTRNAIPTSLDFLEEMVGRTLLDAGSAAHPRFLNLSPFCLEAPFTYRTAFNRIEGVPFAIRDNASAWPSQYDFARLLTTMVLGAQQGWDVIIHRKLDGASIPAKLQGASPPLDLLQSPSFLGILPLGRHLFLRGDLTTAPVVLQRALFSATSYRQGDYTAIPETMQPLLFLGSVAATREDSATTPAQSDPAAAPYLAGDPPPSTDSLTGEMRLDRQADFLRIVTPRTVALAGALPAASADPGSSAVRFALASSPETEPSTPEATAVIPYGVLYATSLDSAPLPESRSILLGAVGKCANTDQTTDISTEPVGFYKTVWRVNEKGDAPILMQPLPATVTLTGVSDGVWHLRPLNLFGQPLAVEPLRLTAAEGVLEVALDPAKYATPLFHLTHANE